MPTKYKAPFPKKMTLEDASRYYRVAVGTLRQARQTNRRSAPGGTVLQLTSTTTTTIGEPAVYTSEMDEQALWLRRNGRVVDDWMRSKDWTELLDRIRKTKDGVWFPSTIAEKIYCTSVNSLTDLARRTRAEDPSKDKNGRPLIVRCKRVRYPEEVSPFDGGSTTGILLFAENTLDGVALRLRRVGQNEIDWEESVKKKELELVETKKQEIAEKYSDPDNALRYQTAESDKTNGKQLDLKIDTELGVEDICVVCRCGKMTPLSKVSYSAGGRRFSTVEAAQEYCKLLRAIAAQKKRLEELESQL